jgi:TolB-like protein/Tfp pilus assembly protein PilF
MQAEATSAAVCPECGTRLEGGFSRGLGRCMICLLRVGFDGAEEPNEAPLSSVTDRLGTYRIERRDDGSLWELGRGAMGVTYRAVDTSLKRPVALKLIDSEWAKRGAEARERFMREARTAASLRHPNVATVYHFGIREENGQCFCAMELVEGETLEMRVRRTGPLDALTTIDIALQVSSALAAAEKQGLVHRDLKPANLMFVAAAPDANDSSPGNAEKAETVVKVIDFGVAKALVEKPDAMGLTHGGFVGTPAFASPEQFTDARVEVRSDIYSLGATLWYLLTGNRPFQGTTIEQIRASQHSQALPIEQLKAAHVPSKLVALLVAMLALAPAARPGIRQLKTQLQECSSQILDRWKIVKRFALAAALVTLVIVAAVLLFPQKRNQPLSGAVSTSSIPPKSIAVLPFRNLSEDKDNAFFADGIQDDLVTSLARIKDLKVVSRGSVASYRDLSGRRLRAIAQELGVGAVLEGSVRRTANRVLVNVQLTDATTERQIWSDRYDRTLEDSIALQGELAAEIATALAAKLSPEEKAQVEAKLTNNPDAYVVYLRGREFQMRPEVSRDNHVAAEQCYRHAVALDPRFALAHARLAEILSGLYDNFDHRPAVLAEARSHAEEALRLDPHCGQAHLEMAQILSWSVKSIERDKAMKQEVDSALRLVPNDGYLVMLAALFQTDMDWLAEAEATFQRAIEINPREPKVFYNYALLQAKKGDVAKARWASDRSLELAPESVYFRLFRARVEFLWTGEVARTKKFLAEIPAGKDPDGRVTAAHCTAAVYERNFPEALRLLAACPSERLPCLEHGFGRMVPKGFLEGLIHFYAGNKERAYTALDSARWILEMEAKENPGDQQAHLHVALAYAAMGWKDAALAEIARAKDKPDEWTMATLFTHAGERDAALRLLEQLPPAEREDSYYDLRLNPQWDPLRSDERFEKMLGSSPSKTAAVPEKSIAVLPFENLSDDQANANFAVGIQDEILTNLARVADLKVISRTSIMQYKAGPGRNLREIGKELGVAHLLEGSVQRDAKRVRVNAQLIDARTDAHLWAQTYDRDLADVFAIQSEIAKAIADQLQAKLSPNEKKAIEQPPTTDLTAFDLYSRAKSLLLTAALSVTNDPDLRKAIELLDEAVKRDPSFFDAYCQLAHTHESLYAIRGSDHTPARLALAEAAVQAATRLRPDAAETHLARAQYLYNGLRDYAGALGELEIARRGLPNDPRLFEVTGYILRRRGQQEEGLQNLQRAVELDPRNFFTLQQIAISYQLLGRYAESIAALDRALAIVPDNVETRANRAFCYVFWKGDTRPLHQTIDSILAQGHGAIASAADAWFFCALAERDPAAAERALVAVGDNPCWNEGVITLSRSFGEGLLARMTKDEARARTAFEAARAQQEKIVQAQPDHGPTLCVLGLIDAALGRKDLALDEGRRAIALTPLEKDVTNGSFVPQYFAITTAWAGDKELALQQLEVGLRAPEASSMLSYGALKLFPVWDPLRGDPRFEKIVASLAPK